MSNRILDQINKGLHGTGRFTRDLFSGTAQDRVKLGLGLTGVTLGVANYRNNQTKMDIDSARVDIDKKSLSALQKIQKALVAKPIVLDVV